MKKVSDFKKNINKIETFITDKEWQTIFKIESLNNPKVEKDIIKYINDITSTPVTKINFNELFKKIRKQYFFHEKQAEKEIDIVKKWKRYRQAYIYYGFIEVLTEGSIITKKILNHFKKVYKNEYLTELKKIDNNMPSALTNIKQEKVSDINQGDPYIKIYQTMKIWQDDQHQFHDNVIEEKFIKYQKEFKEYVFKNYPHLNNYNDNDLLTLIELDNKPIIKLEELEPYIHIGLKKSLAKVIGGKALGLALLKHAGLNVPKTCIIPVSSLTKKYYLDYIYSFNYNTYSIRSSATVEDNQKNSFAGIFKTKLKIPKENLIESIKYVEESQFSKEAILYSTHFKTDKPYMSVIIQEYIEPDYAGVWIGKGLKSGILEYVSGCGEALVSGKRTPISEKKYNLDGIRVKEQSLWITFINTQKILKNTGDFEWAIKNNRLYWLQYRPVTVKIKYSQSKNSNCLKGNPTSPGIVEGKPYFFNEPKKCHFQGILLADYTDPEWLPLMVEASGIITAEGGFLSHAAIIARELGKPCICGVGYETIDKLKNVEYLEMNGTTGNVTIIK